MNSTDRSTACCRRGDQGRRSTRNCLRRASHDLRAMHLAERARRLAARQRRPRPSPPTGRPISGVRPTMGSRATRAISSALRPTATLRRRCASKREYRELYDQAGLMVRLSDDAVDQGRDRTLRRQADGQQRAHAWQIGLGHGCLPRRRGRLQDARHRQSGRSAAPAVQRRQSLAAHAAVPIPGRQELSASARCVARRSEPD